MLKATATNFAGAEKALRSNPRDATELVDLLLPYDLAKMKTKSIAFQNRKMSTKGILEFLEGFRRLAGQGRAKPRTKLISLKVDEALLEAFKGRAALENKKYQTLIKELMRAHLSG